MRHCRIIIALLILAGCKATSVQQQETTYTEDLSVHRPLPEPTKGTSEDSTGIIVSSSSVQIGGHIRSELDSINQIIVAQNMARKWDGYVIQVYSGNSRQEAQSTLKSLRNLFPDTPSSMTYYQPSYRVKIGRYFDKLEAARAFEEMKELFPRAILLPEKLSLSDE